MNLHRAHLHAPAHGSTTLVELLRRRASFEPDRPAYTFLLDGEVEKGSLTYGLLDHQARIIAAHLQELQGAGERALLVYPPGLDYIAGFFGCLYAGVTAVPLYPPFLNRNLSRFEAIAHDAQATLALTTSALLGKMQRLSAQSPVLAGLRWVATDALASGLAPLWREPPLADTSLALLQYTSGSTGLPRGVMLSHGNLLQNVAAFCGRFGLTRQGRAVAWQPLFHDMGLIGMVLNPLYAGFPMLLMSPMAFLQHPVRWLRAISRHRVSFSGAPTFAYDFCVRKIEPEELHDLDLSSWQVAVVGAEPVRPATLERFAQTFARCGFRREAFYPCYGLAEATLIVSGGPRARPPREKLIRKSALERNEVAEASPTEEDSQPIAGCGLPLRGQHVVVVDPESFKECLPDQVGEIWVAGPSVAQGYWNHPAATDECFRAHLSTGKGGPFLRTGDLGFIAKGELYITGRLKDVVIIRGMNHYPQDIEWTVEQCADALHARTGAAFSVEVGQEERLVLVQEVGADSPEKRDWLLETMREAVAREHEIPAYAVVLVREGSIPMTTSGKVQRRACRQQFLSGTLDVLAEWRDTIEREDRFQPTAPFQAPSVSQPIAPGNPVTAAHIQDWLVTRLSQQLHIPEEEVDLLRPFASYGLDSVEAVGLSAAMEAWLGRRLSPTLAWDYPNIQQLSRSLAGDAVLSVPDATQTERPAVGSEMIAIIGMGGRFPGAPNLEAFWRLLSEGQEAITEVPSDRWDIAAFYDPAPATPGKMNTRWGGFLPDIALFDAAFFGISPREAARIDPQQRLLLEVTWEALEDGGLVPSTLAGTQAGVFIGISSSDYAHLLLRRADAIDVYDGTGSALSIAANRLSYTLDLRGPSVAVDTACSSSLVAVHMACQSLLRGESMMALAGGVNLMLAPEVSINLSQARMLSADGRCKPFDAAADGYVRGEGCGIVVLKRLSDACTDGDRILAVIRGTAINQDGRSNGLTAPNGQAQQAVIRAALHNAHLAPSDLGYIEAHGSGTPLGDPIEWQALEAVFRPDASDGKRPAPCAVGTVKTNIGHLEAAAGIAGLMKAVLALQHRRIPAHLHLKEINPRITLDGSPLHIPTRLSEWPARGARLRAGVSSFGFGGTNAHVIVQEPPTRPDDAVGIERPLHLLTLSARTEEALTAQAQRVRDYLEKNREVPFPDICFTANAGREHFKRRLSLIAATHDEAARTLDLLIEGRAEANAVCGHASGPRRPKLAFLFSGQGTQYAGMGRELYQTYPTFRTSLEQCADILQPYLERPFLSLLFAAPGQDALLHQTAYTQPVLFALEYSLAQLWRSWGVEPDAVMGHSLGEYVAACVAGVLRLEDGLKLVAERGRLMQALSETGAMAAIFADESHVAPVLEAYRNQVVIAALNGPANTVISGSAEALQQAVQELERNGYNTRLLPSASHAFHSPLMEPMLDAFEAAARSVDFAAPRIPLVSNRTGAFLPADERPGATYWRDHTREPVRFSSGLQTLAEDGIELFLEVGPHSTLIEMGKRCLPGHPATWLASLQQGKSDWRVLLRSLSELYVHGAAIDWNEFDRGYHRTKVHLPTYPFERRRHWVELRVELPDTKGASPVPFTSDGQSSEQHPLLGRRVQHPRSPHVPEGHG